MFSVSHHNPIKYKSPSGYDGITGPPQVPKGHEGTFHPSFDGRLWLFSRKWEPPPDKVIATLMIMHGTVDHSEVYGYLAKSLNARGIAVFASDMRGWGLSDGESLYFHDLDTFVADVKADYDRIHSQPPYQAIKKRFILGKSLGGLIAAHVVARWVSPTIFKAPLNPK